MPNVSASKGTIISVKEFFTWQGELFSERFGVYKAFAHVLAVGRYDQQEFPSTKLDASTDSIHGCISKGKKWFFITTSDKLKDIF